MKVHYHLQDIPEYYNTMYLDGYTPEQILLAKRRQMMADYADRREQQRQEAEIYKQIEDKLEPVLENALEQILGNLEDININFKL